MAERIAAFLLWAAVAACAVFWGLRVLVQPRPVPGQAAPVSTAGAVRGDVVRLFANPAEPASARPATADPGLASRFKLIGVVAPRPGDAAGARGIALIAVDGKPPRPYRVGARLDRNLVLQSVASRSAAIGPAEGIAAVRLELPPPQAAATGALPPPPANDDPGVLQPRGAAPPGAAAATQATSPAAPSAQAAPAPGARPSMPVAPDPNQIQPVQPAPVMESSSEAAPQRITPDNRR